MDWEKFWRNFGITAILLLPFYVLYLIVKALIRAIFG